YRKPVHIHVFGGPISTAVALHMETLIPNFVIHELNRYALLEPNTQTCKYHYLPKTGLYEVPELPGIGQELTEETMNKSPTITVK
ncbi:enolase C-terminal domain-like protein, partial [Salmonella enterica]|uniref:enolase C-terminal domain-like protein n=1 Tax=Salmonella enterica TaxID=28901 RepID=UPI002ADEAB5E